MRMAIDNVFYTRLVLAVAVIAIAGGGYFLLSGPADNTPPPAMPIIRQTDQQATSSAATAQPPSATTQKPVPQNQKKCVVTGCSGHICTDAADDLSTTCEFIPEYACYKNTPCAAQADGACGWTQTPELKSCIAAARCGAPPDQPAPPPECRYEGSPSCANGQWTMPHLTCENL